MKFAKKRKVFFLDFFNVNSPGSLLLQYGCKLCSHLFSFLYQQQQMDHFVDHEKMTSYD